METLIKKVYNIISIPEKYYASGDKSFYQLVKDSEYFELYDVIHEDIITQLLTQYPAHVQNWIEYSEDQRSSDGWYIVKRVNGRYEVGKHGDPSIERQHLEYFNEINACAAFIKRELEDIRNI